MRAETTTLTLFHNTTVLGLWLSHAHRPMEWSGPTEKGLSYIRSCPLPFLASQSPKLTLQNRTRYFATELTSRIGFVKHPDTRTSFRKEAGLGWRAGINTQGVGEEGRELSAAPSH